MKARFLLPLLLALCLLAGCALAASFSDDPEAINRAALSVMKLEIYDENRDLVATGSGFVAFDNRHLVTNYHVVEDSYQVAAYNDAGEKYILKGVVTADREKDIAILEFYSPTDIPPLELHETGEVLRASKVVAIGSPKGYKNTVSTGIVSNSFVEGGVSMIQITAPISHGSSGGALFDDAGKVIGVTTSTNTEGQNLNFAVNISEVIGLYNAWDQSESALTQPSVPDSGPEPDRSFSMSVFTDYPKIFNVDENREEDAAFIETNSEGKELAFAHRYESDNYYSLIYPDILVLNYSDRSEQFPVMRIWIRYRGKKQLNLDSAEFRLPGGISYTVSGLSSSDRMYTKDDGSFAEDLLIRFGADNMPLFRELFSASRDYVTRAFSGDGDPYAPLPEIRLLLKGDEDLEVILPEAFWSDLGLFCITLPENPEQSFVSENDGNPCRSGLWWE